MGQSQSTSIHNYIMNSTEINNTIDISVKAEANTTTSTSNINRIHINNKGAGECCTYLDGGTTKALPGCTTGGTIDCGEGGLNMNIASNSTVNVVSEVKPDISINLINNLTTLAKSTMENTVEQIDKGNLYPTTLNKEQDMDLVNTVTNSIRQTLSQTLTFEAISNVHANIFQDNQEIVDNCGIIRGNGCNFSIDAKMDMFVSNIATLVANAVTDNSTAAEFYTDLTNKTSQLQSNPLSAFFASLGSAGMIILGIIVIMVLGGMAVGAFMIFGNKKGGGSGSTGFGDYY